MRDGRDISTDAPFQRWDCWWDRVTRLNLLDMKSSFTDQFRCTARCQKPDVVLDQTFRKVQQAGLVVDR